MITHHPGATPPDAPDVLDTAAAPGARPPARWSRLSPGHGMTVTAMVTTLALLVTGAIAAWQVGQMRSRPVTKTSLAVRGPGAARPARARGRAHAPARPASPPTGSPAGQGAVAIAPAAAAQPHVNRVAMLLDSYFSAINQHDFRAYSSLFIRAMRATMHNFGAGYQSTRDSRATLTGLTRTGPEGLAVMVTFVSHQDPADSPDHAVCDRWHIALFVKRNGRDYHIRRHQPGFPADTVRACR